MKVYFIGAGPGAPEPITLRGAAIFREAPLMYAGSLVSRAIDVYYLDGVSVAIVENAP
jgi:precorrin-4/cobalt-precorrin-4 C11-methyltransferase